MISLIVAADQNNAIGFENKLLCNLKDDMRHFVNTTKNKPIIMGRTTFESIGSKPLKDRFNIVLTRTPIDLIIHHTDLLEEYENLVFETFEYAKFITEQSPDAELVVIGGEQVYKLFLPYADRIYLTRIHNKFKDVDAYFPKLDMSEWEVTQEKQYLADKDNDYQFSIFILDRHTN